jgi:hypothetical protein
MYSSMSGGPVRLATTYPRRFTTVIKGDSCADQWIAFTPELALLTVCGATPEQVIESVKEGCRSFIDRAGPGGSSISPDGYKEIQEVEVEVPLKRDSHDR